MTVARVLVAAGGTGGHVYPALALAIELRERGHEVAFVGGHRIETRLVPDAGFRLVSLPVRGLPRSVSPQALISGIALLRSLAGARRALRQTGADVVVGMGGYPSLPPALVAGWSSRPVVLHEQNAMLSLAHRLSLRRARVLALSLPLAVEPRRRGRASVELVGNPIRRELQRLAEAEAPQRARRRSEAASRFDLDPERTTVLVFGGSQGARAVNEAVPAAIGTRSGFEAVQVLHIAGPGNEEAARARWETTRLRRTVLPYVDAMEDAYAVADLVVGRAGASTIAEATALGLPMVLVPLPHAPGGVQEVNARLLEDAGAGRCVLQGGSGLAERLSEALGPLLDDSRRRQEMGERARSLGRPDAAAQLAGLVETQVA